MICNLFIYMIILQNNETVLNLTISDNNSLRIPIHIAKKLGLESDYVAWDVNNIKNPWILTISQKMRST